MIRNGPPWLRWGLLACAGAISAAGFAGAGAEGEEAPACASTLGEQRVAVLLLELPSAKLESTGLTAGQYRDAFFSPTEFSLSGYVREASYGKAWVTGDVFGPFLLERDYKYPEEIWEGYGAAIRAADATVDFRDYARVYLVWPGASGLGASGSVGCAMLNSPTKGLLAVSESIFSIGKDQPYEGLVSFAIHEAGHNFGLNHAAALDNGGIALGVPGAAAPVVEYGDVYSQMGKGRTADTPPQWLFGHYAASHKFRLGWLEPGREMQEVTQGGTFRLQPYASTGEGTKALRIRRGETGDRWLWLEYRQPLGYDRTLLRQSAQPMSGVLAHYEDPALEADASALERGRSYLLDFTSETTPRDFTDAALASGQSWTDAFTPLTVLVSGASETGVDVTVANEKPCAVLNATQEDHGWGAETGRIEVSTAPDCKWTATSNAGWIKITGGAAGSGPGTVSYEITPHSEPGLRTGTIFVGWQTFTVTQASSWISPLPAVAMLKPRWGKGFSGAFTFVFSDPLRAEDLRYVQLVFRGRDDWRQCWVTIAPQAPAIALLKSAENPSIDAASRLVNNGGYLQNSVCSVDVGGLKITAADKRLTVVVPVVFSANLSGPLQVWARADGSGGKYSDNSAEPGTWSVPEGVCRGTAGSGFLFSASESKGAAPLIMDAGCPWVATSGVDWATVTPAAKGEGGGQVNFTVAANTGDYPRVGWLTVAGQTVLFGQSGRRTGQEPLLASNGVLNGASLKPETGITAGSWFTVNGLNLSETTRSWTTSDLITGRMPAQMDGVSVTVNGRSAFIRKVSPMQLEALAPDDEFEGRVAVEVTTRRGRSNGVMVSKQKFAPAFFVMDGGGRPYVAASRKDGRAVGWAEPDGVAPGETILLQGTGFGPTNPVRPTGPVVIDPARAVYPPRIFIGNREARVVSAALVGPGVYEFEVVVPEVANGDQLVVGEISLSITPGGVFLRVQR